MYLFDRINPLSFTLLLILWHVFFYARIERKGIHLGKNSLKVQEAFMFISIGVVLYHLFKRLKFILGDPDLRGMFLVVSIIILLGGFFYHKVEGWSFLDSIYFCIVTLATVGYGDFTPHTIYRKVVYCYIYLSWSWKSWQYL